MPAVGIGNATYLFARPGAEDDEEGLHSSESFWTSIFALYILITSDHPQKTRIPVFNFIKCGNKWKFKPTGNNFVVSSGLLFDDLVVEAKVGKLIKWIELTDIPEEHLRKKPDIIIHKGNKLIIIEAKTIGGDLTKGDVDFYIDLKNIIEKSNPEYKNKVDIYFILSAGNKDSIFNSVKVSNDNESPPFKILLWEHILEAIDKDTCELRRAFNCKEPLSYYYNNLKLHS